MPGVLPGPGGGAGARRMRLGRVMQGKELRQEEGHPRKGTWCQGTEEGELCWGPDLRCPRRVLPGAQPSPSPGQLRGPPRVAAPSPLRAWAQPERLPRIQLVRPSARRWHTPAPASAQHLLPQSPRPSPLCSLVTSAPATCHPSKNEPLPGTPQPLPCSRP